MDAVDAVDAAPFTSCFDLDPLNPGIAAVFIEWTGVHGR